jgi:hypothetical protein
LLEEFNDRILRPELSNDEMLSLHEELQKIYKTYCLDESIDKIRFDPFIVEEIQRSKSERIVHGWSALFPSAAFSSCLLFYFKKRLIYTVVCLREEPLTMCPWVAWSSLYRPG